MTETIPENQDLKRLRECVSSVHFVKQLKGFDIINQEDYDKFTKDLNDKSHTIIDALINSIAGV